MMGIRRCWRGCGGKWRGRRVREMSVLDASVVLKADNDSERQRRPIVYLSTHSGCSATYRTRAALISGL
jgi:hypothetical protein